MAITLLKKVEGRKNMLDELSKELKDAEASEELYETLIAIKVVASRMAEKVLEDLRLQSIKEDFLD